MNALEHVQAAQEQLQRVMDKHGNVEAGGEDEDTLYYSTAIAADHLADAEAELEHNGSNATERALVAARMLRTYVADTRRLTDESPFTMPTLKFYDTDSAAEVEVFNSWGFSEDEITVLMQASATGELTIFRRGEGVDAVLRFTSDGD